MKRLVVIAALGVLLVVTTLCQAQSEGKLSPDDQRRFDSYYSRWLEYKHSNNREEILSMEKRMLDIYAHYGIPATVPYDEVASQGGRPGFRRPSIPHFSGEDEGRFASYYERWKGYRRENNREEIASMERRMQDVMKSYRVPSNTRYGEVMASFGSSNWWSRYSRYIERFSDEDEGRFVSYYSRWLSYRRTNNREEVASMEKRMREVMSQYRVPMNVSYPAVIASFD